MLNNFGRVPYRIIPYWQMSGYIIVVYMYQHHGAHHFHRINICNKICGWCNTVAGTMSAFRSFLTFLLMVFAAAWCLFLWMRFFWTATIFLMNISCRENIWWNKYQVSNNKKKRYENCFYHHEDNSKFTYLLNQLIKKPAIYITGIFKKFLSGINFYTPGLKSFGWIRSAFHFSW